MEANSLYHTLEDKLRLVIKHVEEQIDRILASSFEKREQNPVQQSGTLAYGGFAVLTKHLTLVCVLQFLYLRGNIDGGTPITGTGVTH